MMLGQLFQRLDTTPEQEKVIWGVVEKAKDALRGARKDVEAARAEVANALRADHFDEVLLGAATAKLEAAIDAVRRGMVAAFAEIHATLDAHQRSRLADLIERGRAPGARWEGMDAGGCHPCSA